MPPLLVWLFLHSAYFPIYIVRFCSRFCNKIFIPTSLPPSPFPCGFPAFQPLRIVIIHCVIMPCIFYQVRYGCIRNAFPCFLFSSCTDFKSFCPDFWTSCPEVSLPSFSSSGASSIIIDIPYLISLTGTPGKQSQHTSHPYN